LAYLEDEEKLKWVEGLGIKNYDLNTCEGEFNKGKKVKSLLHQRALLRYGPLFSRKAIPAIFIPRN